MEDQKSSRITCRDGFTISIAVGKGIDCLEDSIGSKTYTNVECGFPNRIEPLLKVFAQENSTDMRTKKFFCKTVYPYVPATVVLEVIEKHGGMIGGTLPLLSISKKERKK